MDNIKNCNLEGKVVRLCADNTDTNFGGRARQSKNNVFCKFKAEMNKKLVVIGCAAHIINNCIQSGCDMLRVDIQTFIIKVYSHFYIYTVRIEKLKKFCNFVRNKYQKLLGYGKAVVILI